MTKNETREARSEMSRAAELLAPSSIKPDEGPDKVVTVKYENNAWSADFWTKDDQTFITRPDFRFIERALRAFYRLYIRDVNLKLRLKKRREAESLEKAGVSND